MIDEEKGKSVLAHAQNYTAEIVKLQAFCRGCIARGKHGRIGKKKNPKKRSSRKQGMSELEHKMLSARSGQFRGGMPSNRRA